jgi:EAL domain-containing protein (putative c-di-GMP-specific phosphodiesterase class I)
VDAAHGLRPGEEVAGGGASAPVRRRQPLRAPVLPAEIVEHVKRALRETGLSARSLDLEITESHAMANAEATIHTLRELKALGVRISIDDFGIGYSSLSYLKRLPIDTLKIDQSFVPRHHEQTPTTPPSPPPSSPSPTP